MERASRRGLTKTDRAGHRAQKRAELRNVEKVALFLSSGVDLSTTSLG